jgi:chemotaxis signal transduction protein
MNNDVIDSAPLNQPAIQAALQNNLIKALTRLQHRLLEKEFLNDSAIVDADAKPESFFGFGLGSHQFMVAASCFCEVFVETAIAAVPNSPPSLVGLSNIRGVLMPVFQLHTALNIQLPQKPIIFAIGKGEAAVGLLIDALPVSLSLSAYQREAAHKPTNLVLQKIVKASYFASPNHWLLLEGTALGAQLLSMANQSYKSTTRLSVAHDAALS